jgi:hypothetical protein
MSRLRLLLPLLFILSIAACASPSDAGGGEANGALAAPADPPAPGAAVFDDPNGWTVARADDTYAQRYKIVDGAIYCETKTTANATVDRVLALLQARWDWYGGALEDFAVHADGSRHYRLWPIGKLGLVNVTEDMSPPIRLANGAVRLIIHLEGYGSGTAYIELKPDPDFGVSIVGRFAGVKSTVLPTEIFAIAHLGAESGRVAGLSTHGGFEGLRSAARGQ